MSKNKDIKIIFIDLDWTLIDHRKHGSPKFDKKSIRGLKKVQKRGIKVFYCTARPYHSISQVGALKVFKPDGLICCNGGMAAINDEVIYQLTFPRRMLNKIAEVVLSHNLTMECTECFDRFLIAPKDQYVEDVFNTYFELTPPVMNYKNKDVISILLFAPEEYDNILKKTLPQGVTYFRFHPSGVDLFATPHEKGTGIKHILKYLNIDKSKSISFGDDLGDISMFNETGISVAMKNGKEEVKLKATYVTKEVWKHGVYHALKHFKLL